MRADTGLRVVIDTNVWISAFLTRTGAPALVVRKILQKGRPVFSPATFAELESRLWLPKFDRYVSLDDRKAMLHDAEALAHWIDVPSEIAAQMYCRDADDDKFIQAALAAKAPWLVTGDLDLLAVPELPDLRIQCPVNALLLIEENN